MAIGDKAADKGLPVVPESKDLKLGFSDINALADALADELTARASADNLKLNASKLKVSATPMTAETAQINDIRLWGE